MTVQINNQSKRFLGFVTGIIASEIVEELIKEEKNNE